MSVRVSLEGVVPENWPLLSATAAVAARTALRNACGVTVGIKWPNDLVVEPSMRKIGGLLTEVVGRWAVVGIGINVAWPAQELPTPESTSVLVEGGRIDRGELLAHLLVELERCVALWRSSPDEVVGAFRRSCVSLGREVVVLLPDGSTVSGTATDVDHGGRLVLMSGETPVFTSAGDVIHATITPWDIPRNS
jgi:BirA family biotin operon repressor/biotin-[acetyl-CoA-carboxylase] ligase